MQFISEQKEVMTHKQALRLLSTVQKNHTEGMKYIDELKDMLFSKLPEEEKSRLKGFLKQFDFVLNLGPLSVKKKDNK